MLLGNERKEVDGEVLLCQTFWPQILGPRMSNVLHL